MITAVPGDLRVILQFVRVKFCGSAFHCVTAASLAVLIIFLPNSAKK